MSFVDWNSALDLLKAIDEPILQRRAAAEAYLAALDAGRDKQLVIDEIRLVLPEFTGEIKAANL